jgi:HrpA-like RNA helicase
VIAALRALYLLNAIGRDHEITALGKVMTKYPLQPCYSKCVILSLFLGGSKDMSIILGALSSEGIWDKDMKEEKWGKLRKEVGVDTGDH